jgi:hypothetical protein
MENGKESYMTLTAIFNYIIISHKTLEAAAFAAGFYTCVNTIP